MYYPPSPPSQPLNQPPYPYQQPVVVQRPRSRWRVLWFVLAGALLFVCSFSCAASAVALHAGLITLPNGMSVPVVSGPRPDGYLYNVPGATAIFITFDDAPHQGTNTGSIVESYVLNGGYFHDNGPWTGTESGSDLVMQYNGATLRGTWQGANLQVIYPTNTGYINTGLFVPASVADYNSAALAIQQSTQ